MKVVFHNLAFAMLAPYPLSDTKQTLLDTLTQDLEPDALHWLSGYFAGAARHPSRQPVATPLPASAASVHTELHQLTIVYGSQTGNAQRVAESLAREAETLGLPTRLIRADRYATRELKSEKLLYIVISTQGEGDPPDDSMTLVEFLNSRRAPKLPDLQYAILGLGDSSYPEFCGIAYAIDKRLEELGAQRLLQTAAADLDIETVSAPWHKQALEHAQEKMKPTGQVPSNVTPLRPLTTSASSTTAPAYSRDHPFSAELLLNQKITARGSERDIRHLELSLEGSNLRYQPGDSLGIWPTQADALVQNVINELRLDANETVTIDGTSRTLQEWLTEHRELTQLTRPFLNAHNERANDPALADLLSGEKPQDLRAFLLSHQLLDVLKTYPATWTAESLVAGLRPLTPRMYSIASSQSLVEDEVHLTLANVAYEHDGQARWGVASHLLSGLQDGDTVRAFVEENSRFRLPEDKERDIIMIGPGTGIAPFRAFVQERSANPSEGRAWLFFGNPHFQTDFLYQLEWQQALEDGTLTRLDVAFSRDQTDKIYVQHKLLEHASEVYDWIQSGAHVYVCGDATRMAHDVHQALQTIARQAADLNAEQAKQWINDLAAQGRYSRDVY